MSVFWAIMNDCNGPFELFTSRATARAALDRGYLDAGCYVAPVSVEKMDEKAAWYEELYENERERCNLRYERKQIVTSIKARGQVGSGAGRRSRRSSARPGYDDTQPVAKWNGDDWDEI